MIAAPTTAPTAVHDAPASQQPLLEVRNLKTYFPVKRGLLRRTVGQVEAVNDVSFTIGQQETLGLVGESGCGKSTVGRTLLRLIPASDGEVIFDGRNVFDANRAEMKKLRRQMQIIFQDPVGSLNPRMTVARIIGEPIHVHGLASGSELEDRVASLLKRVGLHADHGHRYPHEFSGGQRQRIGIARALALEPRFIVCDEPVSALDVSIQSAILNLLNDLQDEFGLSYLFIAHNLAVVEHFCDRVAVMYLGKIVELADRDTLYRNPLHPYTKALLSAAPTPDPNTKRQRIMLEGDVPSPIRLFHGDAVKAHSGEPAVREEKGVTYISRESLLDRPPLKEVPGEPGHFVSTHTFDN
ncbi:ABC transporter ATP-binding protein [Phycisphaerales bacterium AB-hyl4]|uniref:ABC transporter ATP-binding protein n=1 Tax=Natronomicrosphaera hydrolytica TaxID=3242702 RepID=A0ABV4U5C6_9BACT